MNLRLVILAAASAASFGASASTTDWGVHDLLETAAVVTTGPWFQDGYRFSLVGDHVTFTAVSNNLKSTQILDGRVWLFTETAGLVGTFAFDGTTGGISHTFGTLSGGNYYYLVTGVNGTGGGIYAISSTIAAVPEPQTYALLLAGLGVMGFGARRREQ